ncbi:uncharacterized protein LOC116187076 [Punica granatum]|uniref:Uncharacterized protein LOC116187076 n=1 Tax=Punica granatum TaxID=22663 RepID=A0A6P8BMR9_PUNGR|nr:uncharacterized protein LOC116187076 [Punica granatum]
MLQTVGRRRNNYRMAIESNMAEPDDLSHELMVHSESESTILMEKENPVVPLLAMVTSLREEMNKLSPLTPNHCIYGVPKHLRVKNPAAYTPQVVSIGPIHHKGEGLEAMEGYKQRYLQLFLERVNLSLEEYAVFVKDREARLRESYADTINLSSNEFVKVMMIDSAFVYEMLVRICSRGEESCRIFNRPFLITTVIYDLMLLENQIPLFILKDLFNLDKRAESARPPTTSFRGDDVKDLEARMLSDLEEHASNREAQGKPDMASSNSNDESNVEQQRTSNISVNSGHQDKPGYSANTFEIQSQSFKPNLNLFQPAPIPPESGSDLFMEYIWKFLNVTPHIRNNWVNRNKVCSSEVVHLLDCLLRLLLLPHPLMDTQPSEDRTKCGVSVPCLLSSPRSCQDLFPPGKVGRHLVLACPLRICCESVPPDEVDNILKSAVLVPSITKLRRCGVRVTMNTKSTSLLDIKFDCQRGTLEFPSFFMDDMTETVFRNLLAFEQCHYLGNHLLTNYFILLDQLINEPSDVDLLVQSRVLVNAIGNSAQVSSIINNMAQGLRTSPPSYFTKLCLELTEYCEVPWHKWKAALGRDYFSTPWASISVIAAIVLLVLTGIQAVFAIISN